MQIETSDKKTDLEFNESVSNIGYIRINRLNRYNLKIPMDIIIEPDEGGYLARTVDLPLFGYEETPFEALNVLKNEIEMLYQDLSQEEKFSPNWLSIKEFLDQTIEA